MVVPAALRVLRLQPIRRTIQVGDLAGEMGWKHADLIKRLESQRKIKNEAFYARVKTLAKQRQEAVAKANLGEVNATLAQLGY